jgi:hypothetical protein
LSEKKNPHFRKTRETGKIDFRIFLAIFGADNAANLVGRLNRRGRLQAASTRELVELGVVQILERGFVDSEFMVLLRFQ